MQLFSIRIGYLEWMLWPRCGGGARAYCRHRTTTFVRFDAQSSVWPVCPHLCASYDIYWYTRYEYTTTLAIPFHVRCSCTISIFDIFHSIWNEEEHTNADSETLLLFNGQRTHSTHTQTHTRAATRFQYSQQNNNSDSGAGQASESKK